MSHGNKATFNVNELLYFNPEMQPQNHESKLFFHGSVDLLMQFDEIAFIPEKPLRKAALAQLIQNMNQRKS